MEVVDEEKERIEEIAESLMSALEPAIDYLLSFIGCIDNDFASEYRKYGRRVAYHKRLSERNRLHPKKKPRR